LRERHDLRARTVHGGRLYAGTGACVKRRAAGIVRAVPRLVIGPLLRYVGATEATVWVETDSPCRVEVLGRAVDTFAVAGHHYALVFLEDLAPGETHTYEVHLDGRRVWPEDGSSFPPSVIRTIDPDRPATVVFGSCRVAAPHRPPYSLTKDEDPRGREVDALYAFARRMVRQSADRWPNTLVLLGDQVYADEVSEGVRHFIQARRNTSQPPGEEVADFEEYTRLYWEAWGEPWARWLLSTVPTAMIFDDHDVHDDWNTSASWKREMAALDWWEARMEGALMSYWLYQHIGNLSPRELREDPLFRTVTGTPDGGAALRPYARDAAHSIDGKRWSYCRDVGSSRLVVIDSRAGRVLEEGRRSMLDDEEWEWLERELRGDCDHLVVATTLPVLLAHGMHYVEAWNEAMRAGAWGAWASAPSERLRRGLDLEHWAAFERSFSRLVELVRRAAAGERGAAPAGVTILSGDVHHTYLAQVAYRRSAGVESAVHQVVCSPLRNPLDARERRAVRIAISWPARVVGHALARLAGVPDPAIQWRFCHGPWFDNGIGTLILDGREAAIRLEKALPHTDDHPRLTTVIERSLTRREPDARAVTVPLHETDEV
jgi:hypothetical protein